MKVRILNTSSALPSYEASQRNGALKAEQQTGLYATRNHFPLIARVLLSAIFIKAGIDKIMHPVGTQQYMAAHGIPLTEVFLIAAIAIELLGGLFLLLGYQARWGAVVLALFLVPATLIFHSNLGDQIQNIMFMKNLAILGGLFMVIQYGPGQIVLRPYRRR